MINITDNYSFARALDSPIDGALAALLRLRRYQITANVDGEWDIGQLMQVVIVEPGDRITDIETAAGYPIISNPAFEWVAQHGIYQEAVTILSDDGFGIVLIVPDVEGVDPVLLSLLAREGQASAAIARTDHEDGRPPTA